MKTLLFSLLVLFSLGAVAQTPVSKTSPQEQVRLDSMTKKSVNKYCPVCGHPKSEGYKDFQIFKDEVYGFCASQNCYVTFEKNAPRYVRKFVVRDLPLKKTD